MQFVLVGVGGFLGACARYAVVRWLGAYGATFPFATLFVNVLGSFVVGVFATWIFQKTPLEGELRLAIQVGFLGALTTFSTFSLETLNLLSNGQVLKAGANIVLNLVLCLAAAWGGVMLAKALP
ncbi:MAG TPA: fluoride efflux transporter CrcB [Gammaproteobacteria bacterium]|jgi:CrcB protein|nr:fluoride efflux transporter CrcB [Gammaproteobacteria bacterium]